MRVRTTHSLLKIPQSSASKMESCPLLTILPPELRLSIYKYTLVPGRTLRPASSQLVEQKSGVAILRTWRHIYDEASPVLLSRCERLKLILVLHICPILSRCRGGTMNYMHGFAEATVHGLSEKPFTCWRHQHLPKEGRWMMRPRERTLAKHFWIASCRHVQKTARSTWAGRHPIQRIPYSYVLWRLVSTVTGN